MGLEAAARNPASRLPEGVVAHGGVLWQLARKIAKVWVAESSGDDWTSLTSEVIPSKKVWPIERSADQEGRRLPGTKVLNP